MLGYVEVTWVGDAIFHGECTLVMYVTSMGYKLVAYHLGPGWTATTAVREVLKVEFSTEVVFEFTKSF